ncbi:MAG TPA: fimbria/pilus periplasmic chaperone [Allosphingosinicella sp.]|jgi:fimbrial chaperone protein
MLSRPILRSLLAAAALIAGAAPAAAGTLQVDPISVEVTADRKVASLKIKNEEASPVVIRAYALTWNQVDGEDRYEESNALILSPPIFTIKGGATQVVRIGLRSPAAAGKAYRLIVEEVPQAAPDGGVRVALRLNLPLFAMLPQGRQTDIAWSARKDGSNWVLEAANGGQGWVRIDPEAAAKATGLAEDPSLHLGVVLPNSRRRWILKSAPRIADASRFQLIARNGDDEARLASR